MVGLYILIKKGREKKNLNAAATRDLHRAEEADSGHANASENNAAATRDLHRAEEADSGHANASEKAYGV